MPLQMGLVEDDRRQFFDRASGRVKDGDAFLAHQRVGGTGMLALTAPLANPLGFIQRLRLMF